MPANPGHFPKINTFTSSQHWIITKGEKTLNTNVWKHLTTSYLLLKLIYFYN